MFILWGLCGVGVSGLVVGDMSGAAGAENVLAAFDASEENGLAAGVKRPALLACMPACQAVVTDYTQETLVVNAGKFGLDAGGELRCCGHTRVVGWLGGAV
jgi:hypothetical protein